MTKTNESLSQIFDVNPVTGDTIVPAPVSPPMVADDKPAPNQKLEDDFELARTTMQNVLLKGSHSLEVASMVAAGSEDPNAFQAVGGLLARLTDAAEKLVGLHEKKAKSEPKAATGAIVDQQGATNINGPVFVGSTSELAKYLNDQRNK